MKKIFYFISIVAVSTLLMNGCAGNTYDAGYNNNSYVSQQDKDVSEVLAKEMNSLSDADIAQLNTLTKK